MFKDQDRAFIPEAVFLHFSSVLFKPSLIIGACVWVSFFVSLVQIGRRKEYRLPLALCVVYFLFLMKMPWAQPFYMMPLFPIMVMIACDQFFRLLAVRRFVALGLGAIAGTFLLVDMILCYPDYNLNGYQWLGQRYLMGRSTICYRCIVQTPSDGLQQALTWVTDHVRSDKKIAIHVGSYETPSHIVRAYLDRRKYRVIDGWKQKSAVKKADYVVININAQLSPGFRMHNPSGEVFKYPYDNEYLHEHFDKVYSVKRRFGLEVASVWQRRSEDKT